MRIRDAVVVITGASSGIGRATALRLAKRKATVVLAARRKEALETLAHACEKRGGLALPVQTDVTDDAQVQALARRAISTFGRIDVWFNNAGVLLVSRFEDAPPDEFKRVLETNFLGYVHGARAVLPIFREQGRGILIQNASAAAELAGPYLSAYSAAKFAVRGFSESLREELQGTDIRVCTVMPGSIDTPLWQSAANHTGRALRPISSRPARADEVAREVAKLIEKPRREVGVASTGPIAELLHLLAPGRAEKRMARKVEAQTFAAQPAPESRGTLFQPGPIADASGGWRSPKRRWPWLVAAGLGVAAAAAELRPRRRPLWARLVPALA